MAVRVEELIAEQRQRNQSRIAEMINTVEGILTTLHLWAKEEGGDGKPRKKVLEMAAIVLKEYGKPMHAKAITERIQAKFGFSSRLRSVGTMLLRASDGKKKGALFVKDRAQDNTYGLREWEHK